MTGSSDDDGDTVPAASPQPAAPPGGAIADARDADARDADARDADGERGSAAATASGASGASAIGETTVAEAPEPPHRPIERAAKTPARLRRLWGYVKVAAELGLVVVAIGTLVLWCSVPDTRPLADDNPTSTAFIELRRDQAEAAGKRFELHWQWRPIGRISRYLRAAVIYAEDYNFYRHDGVDWGALEEAVETNLDKGSLAIGGSTITQQLAKNLYLSPDRSVLRKAREMLIAFSLEDHLSKQRILELYLNVVEWGDGVFGAEAAARHWFGHSAQTLSPAEAVRLAIALPNPIARAPSIHSAELTKKAVRIIRLLRMQGLLDEGQERDALDQVGASDEKVLPSHPAPDADRPPTRPPETPSGEVPAPAIDPPPPPPPETPTPPDPPSNDEPDTPSGRPPDSP